MKITFDWLKDHLKTSLKEKNLFEQLTNIGLEVEGVQNLSSDKELFKVAKIIKTIKHPNADRLKVCDVNIGEKELKKVVCGAANAVEGLITVYAPPGTVIPNNKINSMQQPVNVNFNINTVDARGFNELLANSRGVIVNMINQAVNEKGRMAIV